MKKLPDGMLPAIEIVGYISLIAGLFVWFSKMFSHGDPTLAPIMMLTIFSFSVLVCALIVFYKPYMLFMEKKGKEAANLVLATTKWLGILAVIVTMVMATLSR